MQCFVLLTVTVLFVTVLSYPYNHLENQFLSRSKRSPEELYLDDDYVLVCCDKLQKVGKLTPDEIEVLGACQDEVENKLGVRDENTPLKEYFLNYSTCGNQCLFEKHGWIEEDGNITEQAAVQIATTQLGVEDETLLQEISRHCPAVSSDYTENRNENYTCKRTAMMFYTCAFDIMNLNCPEEHVICNEGCDRRMQRIKTLYQ
ncbi:hypothetical protein L9F63_017273 [Diploptera punctata]|uniref:Uncharacterized protein n=1 Tax=Diploptera punctata TaxID=6984 RepID=A0AAD7ZZ99_DIPPU|nr:hypothetical protein L9F63_017273 [Diploptera punctata]